MRCAEKIIEKDAVRGSFEHNTMQTAAGAEWLIWKSGFLRTGRRSKLM